MRKRNYKAQKVRMITTAIFVVAVSAAFFAAVFLMVQKDTVPIETINPSIPIEAIDPPAEDEQVIINYTPVPGGVPVVKETSGMKLTDDEIEEITAILRTAEQELYYQPSSELFGEFENEAFDEQGSEEKEKEEKKPEKPAYRSVSVYFEDLTSGAVFEYKADEKYYVASIIKAPYCLYIYQLAEKGECDLNEMLTIEYSQVRDGTGKIRERSEDEFPVAYTVSELISLSLRWSDNTAMERLRLRFPAAGFAEFAKSLGVNYPEDIKSATNGNITARDANVYNKAIYNYIENGKYGTELKEHMSNTVNPFIRSDYPVVRKYGWTPLAIHDMAVIYAPHPYLLTICSNRDMGKASDYKLFRELSMKLQEIHDRCYPEDKEAFE